MKIGNVVRVLNTDLPAMTVEAIYSNLVATVWFDDSDNLHRSIYYKSELS